MGDLHSDCDTLLSVFLHDFNLKGCLFDLDVPEEVTIDDVLPFFQGYPNRPAQSTTPNAHAPDPAVSFLKLLFLGRAKKHAYAKGKPFYYCGDNVPLHNTRYN